MQNSRSGLISKQLKEIIEWTDTTANTLIYKFPVHNDQIKNGAQLTVRESQVAIFICEGRIGDIFPPGRYQLTTRNIPIISSLKGWKYGFESPFKADVYFVSTRQFVGYPWGTANPILTRDEELGIVRLRGYGNFAFRITDPAAFFKEIAGTNPNLSTETVEGHLRGMAVSVFSDTLAKEHIPVFNLSAMYLELGRLTLSNAKQRFSQSGISLSGFIIESISLTEEVERHVDKRTSMNIIRDMDRYAKFQLADSIPEAMANPGGMAGLGASFALGQQIANALRGNSNI